VSIVDLNMPAALFTELGFSFSAASRHGFDYHQQFNASGELATRRLPMGEFTVSRTLKAPIARVWWVLTQPSYFERWLPAKSQTAVLDVRTGGSWRATVVSAEGEDIPLTGRYDEVAEPSRLVMTVPGGEVATMTLAAASNGTTQIVYSFDVDESMHAMVTDSVDAVLGRISKELARIG
jgi:uncharacterized protein YndB with AHSA1/START domain